MDQFETDVMEDLMYEAAEGPANRALDDYDGIDGADEWDGGDEGDDEFLTRLQGGAGRALGGLMGGGASEFDEYDEMDGYDASDEFSAGDEYEAADEYEAHDGIDAMEEAVSDAMDAGDGDEFFRRLRRIASGVGRVASTVGRGIGQAARVVGPIASMLPIPQAQLIGRIANVAGRLLADGADEFEAFDALIDGLDEDGVDAAAPVLAGMVIRRALPSVARAGGTARRAAVHGVTQAVRQAVRRQGPAGARAVARAVAATRQVVRQRRLAPPAAARAVRQVAQQVARRPVAVRRLARPLVPQARRITPRAQAARVVQRNVAPVARRVAQLAPVAGRPGAGRGVCQHCARRMSLRAPVTITIRGR